MHLIHSRLTLGKLDLLYDTVLTGVAPTDSLLIAFAVAILLTLDGLLVSWPEAPSNRCDS